MSNNQTYITHRDPKGRHVMSIVEAAFNEARLNDAGTHRVSMRGNAFKTKITALLRELAATFNPAEFIGKGWYVDPADEQLLSVPEDIDPTKVVFKNMFRGGETSLKGEERIRRHREAKSQCLNADHFLFFWNNKEQIPEEWKQTENGQTRYILFDGTIVRNSDGNRYVLCLYWSGGEWDWYYGWLGRDFGEQYESAMLAS